MPGCWWSWAGWGRAPAARRAGPAGGIGTPRHKASTEAQLQASPRWGKASAGQLWGPACCPARGGSCGFGFFSPQLRGLSFYVRAFHVASGELPSSKTGRVLSKEGSGGLGPPCASAATRGSTSPSSGEQSRACEPASMAVNPTGLGTCPWPRNEAGIARVDQSKGQAGWSTGGHGTTLTWRVNYSQALVPARQFRSWERCLP